LLSLGRIFMALDAHRVFRNSGESRDYLTNLTLKESAKAALRNARDDIRETLRVGLRDWSLAVDKGVLFEDAFAKVDPPALSPKFRMQGSLSYGTCNDPAHQPPQEIDLDDGLFLPISFLAGHGTERPVVISAGLFLAVERILEPLCKRRGWRLNKSKASCVRIELQGHAHVDLALYAIPDQEFARLVEKAARSVSKVLSDQVLHDLQESRDLTEEIYRGLSSDQIMLAHRVEGWKPSDPRKLEDWFQEAVKLYGEQLRRVSRYVKGWRDYQWETCRLASIALMSAVVTAYQEAAERVADNRDDLAMLMVAERLPEILSGFIANPVLDRQRLDENWTREQRAEFVAAAHDLVGRLQDALVGTNDPKVAIANLVAAFGPRIPNDTDLVRAEEMRAPAEKSAVSAPAVLRLGRDQMAASIASLDDAERQRRAEAAAREAERQGPVSKPWVR
jgi:cyclic GMP-AMP synthase